MDTISLRSRVFSLATPSSALVQYFLQYARRALLQVIEQGIRRGTLIIEDTHGIHSFGDGQKQQGSTVHIKVHDEVMWGQVLLSNDLGFAEAYMQGHCDVSDLKGFLNLWLDNRDGLAALSSTFSAAFSLVSHLINSLLFSQNQAMARWSAEISYDVSNEFMQAFLSKDMMYSAALWGEQENGPRGDLTVGPQEADLEAAQQRKVAHFIRNARLRKGDRLLEIGSGWGTMAIAAGKLGCEVDTITLSKEQKELAEERIAAAGLSDTVRVHLCDYRELPASFEHQFDACISCEMIEAVGHKNYGAYFRVIDWALKKDRGTVVISSTTQPESRYTEYQPEDFARRYHWPNNFAPSPTSLLSAIQTAAPGKFVTYSIEDHGIHYCRTLREWARRFQKNFKGDLLENMQAKYPFLKDPRRLDEFKRKWIYLFVYAEVGYARAYTSLHHFVWTRPENVIEPCA